jgi:hypothetical protein
MTSDDETLNLIAQRPGDKTVRIAEASVGDIPAPLGFTSLNRPTRMTPESISILRLRRKILTKR